MKVGVLDREALLGQVVERALEGDLPMATPTRRAPQIVARTLTPETLEPELIELVMPIARRWEAAALRVAAAHVDPKVKLPTAATAPEALLAEAFGTIVKQRPDAARQAGERAVAQLRAPKTAKRLGAGLNLDFSKADSVEQLVTVADPVLTKAEMLALVERHRKSLGLDVFSGAKKWADRRLDLDLMSVRCIDETNGPFGSEAGQDEIDMSGLTIDATAATGKITPFRVGDFDDGTVKTYSPAKRLVTYSGGGTTYPRHFFTTLLLFEHDRGDLNETMTKILQRFADEVAAKVAAAVGTELGPAAGALIGWLTGWLAGRLVGLIVSWWEDDPFKPVTLEIVVPSGDAAMPAMAPLITFRGPGEYRAQCRWTVSTPRQLLPELAPA